MNMRENHLLKPGHPVRTDQLVSRRAAVQIDCKITMRPHQNLCIILVVVLVVLLVPNSEAGRRKHKGDDRGRSKTKTKWSSSTDLGGANTQIATEEHGYYVKRTYSAAAGIGKKQQSPPYLAVPIAWFSCDGGQSDCQSSSSNSAVINSAAQALSEGYLCDDDCVEPYDPICGKTSTEVAVFYNQCKLNVAKCRTHGMWTELPYDQCQTSYPKETVYADKKFRTSAFFRANDTTTTTSTLSSEQVEKESNSSGSSEEDKDDKKNLTLITLPPLPKKTPPMPLETAMSMAFDEITSKLSEAEAVVHSLEADKEQIKPTTNPHELKYEVA